MSEWESYYKTEGNEEEEEQEENLDASGEYKCSGRDSLIFLVDTSMAMFGYQDEEELSPFDMNIQYIQRQQGKKRFQDQMDHGSDHSFSEVLWVCVNLFSDVQVKMSHKIIMLFTNEDDPHRNDSTKASQARTKASDLRDTGIFLELMHLKKPGGFDISLFYRDIISVAEDKDLGVHLEVSSKLEDLMRKVRAKETKKRPFYRLKFKFSKDTAFTVGIYNLLQKAFKSSAIRLYWETNEPVKVKTQIFSINTGSLLLPSYTKRSQTYGNHQILMEKEETEELKWFDEPGLILIGFKPLVMLKKHHYLQPSMFMYPKETLEEELDDQNIQVTPPGLQLFYLLFADDKWKVPITEKVKASPEQVDKMKAIIQKLRFKYRSDDFENPVLQQHCRNLEALALDLMEPEQVVDLTLPKVEEMDKRLGSLVDEFKELVYPPDYTPDRNVTKRKQDDEGSGSERPKVEFSEEEPKAHISKGTLGKLTVPVLKEACRVYELKSEMKKQELMDAFTQHFQEA
ncbi:X-ray repair cross-complementing protein 6 [Tupaia chinensis]|uniref:X-ray repair cross-complementing protein 6 n=1 Tax=Tupaia chinensis TaxID=246437 RepID=L9KWW0_TUPCH|nr:X-ray repair cross-complementing protein 6 [Tupaia chinensis]